MKKLVVGILVILASAALITVSTWALSLREVDSVRLTELRLSSLRGPIRKNRIPWTFHNEMAVPRRVEVGRAKSGRVGITVGVKLGDMVINPGEAPRSEGMKVRVAGR
jgi:hypothetical protein